MYDLRQIIKGLSMFIDNDILPKVSGWQKWVIGAGMGVALDKSVNIFEELKNNEIEMTMLMWTHCTKRLKNKHKRVQ